VGNINIDFDQVYSEVIFPVSEMAGVRMIQAGEYLFESSFQSVATEQMLRADVVVADISGANPNVLYQVGLRHAARSNVTLLLSGAGRVPFDLQWVRFIAYDPASIFLESKEEFQDMLTYQIHEGLRNPGRPDSPVFSLFSEYEDQIGGRAGGAFVFLSYAREDEKSVLDIYRLLRDAGFSPWMDLHNLIGGEDWDSAIRDSQEKADFTVVFLSTKSTVKKGYFQKEFRRALEQQTGRADGQLFLIPVRLDDVEIPTSVNDLHVIDWQREGWSKLVKSLERGAL